MDKTTQNANLTEKIEIKCAIMGSDIHSNPFDKAKHDIKLMLLVLVGVYCHRIVTEATIFLFYNQESCFGEIPAQGQALTSSGLPRLCFVFSQIQENSSPDATALIFKIPSLKAGGRKNAER